MQTLFPFCFHEPTALVLFNCCRRSGPLFSFSVQPVFFPIHFVPIYLYLMHEFKQGAECLLRFSIASSPKRRKVADNPPRPTENPFNHEVANSSVCFSRPIRFSKNLLFAVFLLSVSYLPAETTFSLFLYLYLLIFVICSPTDCSRKSHGSC